MVAIPSSFLNLSTGEARAPLLPWDPKTVRHPASYSANHEFGAHIIQTTWQLGIYRSGLAERVGVGAGTARPGGIGGHGAKRLPGRVAANANPPLPVELVTWFWGLHRPMFRTYSVPRSVGTRFSRMSWTSKVWASIGYHPVIEQVDCGHAWYGMAGTGASQPMDDPSRVKNLCEICFYGEDGPLKRLATRGFEVGRCNKSAHFVTLPPMTTTTQSTRHARGIHAKGGRLEPFLFGAMDSFCRNARARTCIAGQSAQQQLR